MPRGDNPNSRKNLLAPFNVEGGRKPKNPGRKPSTLKKYLKTNNLTADDIANLAKWLMPKTQGELLRLIKDPKTPIIIKTFSNAVLRDLKNGNLANIQSLLDRAFGKPKEHREVEAWISTGFESRETREIREAADAQDRFIEIDDNGEIVGDNGDE